MRIATWRASSAYKRVRSCLTVRFNTSVLSFHSHQSDKRTASRVFCRTQSQAEESIGIKAWRARSCERHLFLLSSSPVSTSGELVRTKADLLCAMAAPKIRERRAVETFMVIIRDYSKGFCKATKTIFVRIRDPRVSKPAEKESRNSHSRTDSHE